MVLNSLNGVFIDCFITQYELIYFTVEIGFYYGNTCITFSKQTQFDIVDLIQHGGVERGIC